MGLTEEANEHLHLLLKDGTQISQNKLTTSNQFNIVKKANSLDQASAWSVVKSYLIKCL